VVLLLTQLSAGGCSFDGRSYGSVLDGVMSDFAYVGSGEASAADSSLGSGVVHGLELAEVPQELRIGYSYVFHRLQPSDDERLALEVLPRKVVDQGLNLTRYPAAVKDLVFSFIGGPYFSIEFRDGTRRFLLRSNRCDSSARDLQLADGYSDSDYVLELLNNE